MSVIFHSVAYAHCEMNKIGEVYTTTVKDKSCVSYALQDAKDENLEIYVSKREFSRFSYSILLCGNVVKGSHTIQNLVLTKEVIAAMCANSIEAKDIKIIWSITTSHAEKVINEVRADYAVQYQSGWINLAEGVSYNIKDKSKESYQKIFTYKLLNKEETRIILNPIRGNFNIYAKIVKASQRYSTTISEINYEYSSTT